MARIHVGFPLSGRCAPAGRDLLRGAELALERAGAADVAIHDTAAGAGAAARAAAADPVALAFVGDMRSVPVHEIAPVLAEAGLLQIAPVATWTGLGGP